MINAKVLFCCGMLSKGTKATDKPSKPEIVVNPELEPETKPASGSLYSGITGAVYNLGSNLSSWLFGGDKSSEKNESSEGKENDKKEH